MRTKLWVWPAVLLFLILADVPSLLENTTFYAFQSRDLHRAGGLLKGNWIFFGPEMTGGGHLPGPLYYFILAPALLFGGWLSAWLEMIALAAAGAAAGWWYFHRRGAALPALLCCVLFAASPVAEHFLTLFLNPSYLFVLIIPALVLACLAFDDHAAAPARARAFAASAALVACATQLHYSAIFLLPALLTLQAMAPRWNLPRVPGRAVLWGVAAFPLTALPYLAWRWLGQEGGPAGPASDVLPVLWHLLSTLEKVSAGEFIQHAGARVWQQIPPALPLITAALWLSRGRESVHRSRAGSRFKVLLVCAVYGFIPFSYIFAVPIANRYGFGMFAALALLTAAMFEAVLETPARLRIYNLLAAAATALFAAFLFKRAGMGEIEFSHTLLLLVAAFTAALLTEFNSKRLPLAKIAAFTLTAALALLHREHCRLGTKLPFAGHMVRFEQWRQAWHSIVADTGWDVEQIKRRIFFVNAHIDGDPEPVLRQVIGGKRTPRPQPVSPAPSGYFVLLEPPLGDPAEWLSAQPIAGEIKSGLRSGAVRLGVAKWSGLWLLPYFIDARAEAPSSFHNWALFYGAFRSRPQLPALREGVEQLAPGRFRFQWNECPEQAPYCAAAADVTLERSKSNRYEVRVEVIGDALSQNSPWIHPQWTQSWTRPYLQVHCGNKAKILRLADSLGYRREYLKYQPLTHFFVANNSLLAPFERHFTIECGGKISALTVGREGGTADRVRSVIQLPPKELTVRL